MTTFNVGTSGYSYSYWKSVKGIKNIYNRSNNFKEYIASYQVNNKNVNSNSVEINVSRYRKISRNMVNNWYKSSPKDFKFSIKMPEYITNYKKLNDFTEWWDQFYNVIKHLKEKLGCLLFLFNKNFKLTNDNIEKLKIVKHTINSSILCSFEFRDNKWYDPLEKLNKKLTELFKDNWTIAMIILKNGGISNVNFGNLKSGVLCNNNINQFMYIRFHGLLGYSEGTYPFDLLLYLVECLVKYEIKHNIKLNVFIYFNNVDTWEPFYYLNNITNNVNQLYPISHYTSGIYIKDKIIPSAMLNCLWLMCILIRYKKILEH